LAKIISKKKYINKEKASFVFISSVMGILGQPGIIAYCASKGALISGVKSIAL
jgi:NAD(P)-dependent dehydrogenase (short-subunit alcohol dehydrogenase family)